MSVSPSFSGPKYPPLTNLDTSQNSTTPTNPTTQPQQVNSQPQNKITPKQSYGLMHTLTRASYMDDKEAQEFINKRGHDVALVDRDIFKKMEYRGVQEIPILTDNGLTYEYTDPFPEVEKWRIDLYHVDILLSLKEEDS